MEYRYKMFTCDDVTNHAFYILSEKIKEWLIKYTLPGLNAKLLVSYNTSMGIPHYDDDGSCFWATVSSCRFFIYRNDDIDTKKQIIFMSRGKKFGDDVNKGQITIEQGNEVTVIYIKDSDNDSTFVRLATFDINHNHIKSENTSNDCKAITAIIKTYLNDIYNNWFLFENETDNEDEED